ncbi:MAG: excinuclease ABC subunit B [Verrucomicrobia bacterium]|nr:excinuclease ABC subunit B [Verrucomicrobiota bacterium]
MLCEICRKNDATMHFKQVFEGAVREVHVCGECAAEKGFDTHLPESLADFLFGGAQQPAEKIPEDRACRICGMRFSDFKKASLLGCPNCYETHAAELVPVIRGMQRGMEEHKGKFPASARVTAEVERLQKALKEAVAAQNFEEAARLRDQIRAARETPDAEQQPAGRC